MNKFKKLVAGVMLGALAVTAVAPAAVSADNGKNIPLKLLALNEKTGKFDTLIAAATCEYFIPHGGTALDSEVIQLLASLDRGTLFAPTDRAFRKSLAGVSDPCALPKETLFGVLADHVTDDRVSYWELFRKARRGGTIDTFGGDVDVNRAGGKWWRPRLGDDNARIVGNRGASNGQIKIINRVILQS